MGKGQVHIIQRMEAELNVPLGRQAGERLSRRLLAALSDELLPALEREFDRLVAPNTHFRLEKLTVDLDLDTGRIQLNDLISQLKEKVVEQLSVEIKTQAQHHQLEDSWMPNDQRESSDQLNGTGHSASASNKLMPKAAHALETLIYLLRTGYYPWWWHGGNWSDLETALSEAIRSGKGQLTAFFRSVDFSLPVHRKRFTLQLSQELQEQLLLAIWGSAHFERYSRELRTLKSIMTKLFPAAFRTYQTVAVTDFLLYYRSQGQLPETDNQLWTDALAFWKRVIGDRALPGKTWQDKLENWSKTGQIESRRATLIRRSLSGDTAIEMKSSLAGSLVEDGVEQTAAEASIPASIRKRLEKYLSRLSPRERKQVNAWLDGKKELSAGVRKILLDTLPDHEQALKRTIIEQSPEIRIEEHPEQRESRLISDFPEGGVYLGNAGLVLLHPYLVHFFRATGLCKQDDFASEAAQEKAVHVLQYLAAKRLRDPDPDLVLNKVLCGLPPDQPVARHYRISKKVKAEADHLLQVVLDYWKALGNTSIDGLRFNFLLREGKLSKPSGDWKLLVERKPQDMLLESLPWGFGLIKLPWMKEKMFVEW